MVLVPREQAWVAWWVGDPEDRRLEIDVCLPAERLGSGWRYVDLELDPVRHEADGRVEIEDPDELASAERGCWLTPSEADLARTTAAEMAGVLRNGQAGWLALGWHRLATLV